MYQEKWRPFDGLLQKPVHIHRICGEIARQGRRFTQLLLVAAVFNHMHKRGNGALWGTVGWQPGFTKQTPCLLRGEFAAPVGQQGNVFTAGMVSTASISARALSLRRNRAGRMDNHQRIKVPAIQQNRDRLNVTIAAGIIAQIEGIIGNNASR